MNIRKGDWVIERPSWHTRDRPPEQGRVVRFIMGFHGFLRVWMAVVRIGKHTELFCVHQLRVVRRRT